LKINSAWRVAARTDRGLGRHRFVPNFKCGKDFG
jgi:hypothetical protein